MKLLIFVSTILFVAINNNTIEILTDKQYETSTIMIYRGFFSLSLFLLFSLFTKNKLRPKKLKPQLFRLLIDGLSIWLLYTSYKYLSAGTVALFQRMDIPILIIISVVAGQQKSSLQFYLSIWAAAILAFFIADAKLLDEDPIGFAFALSSVFLLSTTYFLVQKQTKTENRYSLGFIYSLGMILWGFLFSLIKGTDIRINISDLWIFVTGGLLQFLLVYLALFLFNSYSAEKARLPFILGAFATLLAEMIIEQKLFTLNHIGLSVILTGIIATICIDPQSPTRNKNAV